MPPIRVEAVFTGSVQGVGFRYSTARIAEGFPLGGWVRNEPDGSVRLVAEGDEADLDSFIAAIRARMAPNIRDVRLDRFELTGEFGARFEIRR